MFFVRVPDRERFGDGGFFCIELKDDLCRDLIRSIVIIVIPLIEIGAEGWVGTDEWIVVHQLLKYI